MSARASIVSAVFLLGASLAVPAAAQDPDAPPPGTIVVGPARVTPGLAIKDLGMDNNVFNDAVDPKSDFTFTLTPRLELGLRARRVRTTLATATDYVYYRKYDTERGANLQASAKIEVDLGRLHPYVTAEGVNTKSRLNTEVDARARHHDVTYGAGIDVNVASRTHLLLTASRMTVAFDPDQAFRGVDLRDSFDGRRDTVGGGMAIDVTPITRFSLLVTREQQRFDESPLRDSDTWRVTPGLTFSTTGLLRGSASVGYRRFHPRSPLLPDYSGLVSSVGIGATIYGRNDLQATANRDVQYSYEDATAYYVGTTLGVTWTTRVAGPFDVRGTANRGVMNYTDVSALAGRDVVRTLGGGIGFRFGQRARLGVNLDWSRRESDRSADRTYRNHRIFAGLTWGAAS